MENSILTPDQFRTLRLKAGLSQAKIARDLSITRSYLSQFENGRYQFDQSVLLELRDYLDAQVRESTVDLEDDGQFIEDSVLESLQRIQEILATPVPKFIFFDDEDELDVLRDELLREALSLIGTLACAQGIELPSREDRDNVSSRVIRA